jgi:hypothetical protein
MKISKKSANIKFPLVTVFHDIHKYRIAMATAVSHPRSSKSDLLPSWPSSFVLIPFSNPSRKLIAARLGLATPTPEFLVISTSAAHCAASSSSTLISWSNVLSQCDPNANINLFYQRYWIIYVMFYAQKWRNGCRKRNLLGSI